MDPSSPEISFIPIDSDADYPGFAVHARADGYCGSTEIWLSRADLRGFVDALDALDDSLRGEARLRCGWKGEESAQMPDETNLDLVVRAAGQAGRLEVAVSLCASPRWQYAHTVSLTFALPEPNALTRFRGALRELATASSAASAVLSAYVFSAARS